MNYAVFYKLSKHTCTTILNYHILCTIGFIAQEFPVLEQKHTYLHSRRQYVQHTHTRIHIFTRYNSMYAIYANLKILKILTKMII